MKKIMMIALAAALFCSCAKENTTPAETQADGISVRITFGNGEDGYSRAFFDNTATAEPWEKKVHNLTLFVFSENGGLVMRKSLSATEVANMEGWVFLSESLIGTACTMVALANHEFGYNVTKLDDLKNLDESNLQGYNGLFSWVNTGSKPENGFTMSGQTSATIDSENVNAVIKLKRIVAKVAVRIDMAEDFPDRYAGAIAWVEAMWIENVRDRGLLFPEFGGTLHTDKQTNVGQNGEIDGTVAKHLFYLYEQKPDDFDEGYYMRMSVAFDQDGNSATTNDRVYKYITVPLKDYLSAGIKHNGYYRIQGTITDFEAVKLNTLIVVEDWETPETSDFGNITIGE